MYNYNAMDRRTLISCLAIFFVMLFIGILFSSKVYQKSVLEKEIVNKAIKISDTEKFEYCLDTNVGNVLIYGELKGIDLVSFPEIKGKYMEIEKVKEEYTMHTRTVTDSDGNIRIETYWSWDFAGKEVKNSERVKYLGQEFPMSKFILNSSSYLQTKKVSSDVRYKYYITKPSLKGTILTNINDHTIEEGNIFYEDIDIEKYVEMEENKHSVLIFWFAWIILIVFIEAIAFNLIEGNW